MRIADFALDLIDAVRELYFPALPVQSIDVRVGIASGPVATGVVGLELPHYTVFDDTVNMAARMEQSSEGGRIHYTSAVAADVAALQQHFATSKRPRLTIKGKESADISTYWIDARLPSHKPLRLPPSQLLVRENGSLMGLRRHAMPPVALHNTSFVAALAADLRKVVQRKFSKASINV